jgi:hypothetical protein
MTPPTNPEFKAPLAPAEDPTTKTVTIKDVAAGRRGRSALVVDENAAAPEPLEGFQVDDAGHYVEHGWLPLSEMEVDPRVQRPEVPTEINKIARTFMKEALGTATMWARWDEEAGKFRYFVLDGQQRRAGALLAGYIGDIRVDVHYNLTLPTAAKLFRVLNEKRNVSPVELFKIARTEGDSNVLAVQKILDDLGIPFGTSKGYSGAASARRLVARRNGTTNLRWALTQVQNIYDETRGGGCYDAQVVEAFFWLYDHFGSQVDEENLYAKLASHKKGTDGLVGHAKTIKTVRNGSLAINLIRAIIARYNEGLRSARRKLPDWTLEPATSSGPNKEKETAAVDADGGK